MDIYDQIAKNYECHKSNLAHSGSKNIAWTTYDIVNKAWSLRYDNYTSALIQDAGKWICYWVKSVNNNVI